MSRGLEEIRPLAASTASEDFNGLAWPPVGSTLMAVANGGDRDGWGSKGRIGQNLPPLPGGRREIWKFGNNRREGDRIFILPQNTNTLTSVGICKMSRMPADRLDFTKSVEDRIHENDTNYKQ